MQFFFLAHGLRDHGGHYLTEAEGWQQVVEESGFVWRGYAHAELDATLAASCGVTPLFAIAPHAVLDLDPISRPIHDFLRSATAFAAALNQITSVTADDVILVAYASEREVLGVAQWLSGRPPDQRPRVGFLFHVPDFRWSVSGDRHSVNADLTYWRYAMNQLLAELPRERLYVATIEPRLAKVLQQAFRVPIHLTPLTSAFRKAHLDRPVVAEFDFGIAGGWRDEKGSEIFATLVAAMAQKLPHASLAVQVPNAAMGVQLAQIVRTANPRFRLDVLIGKLPADAFIERMRRCRFALLAYRPEKYALRGSGIAADAFTHGIPIITPANTWMADRLAEGYGAGVCFEACEIDPMIRACSRALEQYDQLAQDALARAPRWRRENSPRIALDRLRAALKI